jgi:uncharacterized protein (TIGR03437 family)
MKLARVTLLVSLAAGWPASAQTWDSSGNSMLNGTYYFRETAYVLADYYGDLNRAIALYGNITFNGTGSYTLSAIVFDSNVGQQQTYSTSGTYVISASGYGYISSALASGAAIYGLVSQQGIFVGSATESYFDLFIAAPVSLPGSLSTFKGSYWIADMDLSSGSPPTTISSMFQLNPDGAGNLGSFTVTGYVGENGATVTTQNVSALKYTLNNGAYSITFPTASNALVVGQKLVYISPDGNFVFGGSPGGPTAATPWDMFVGVRMGSGTPSFSGLYYQAGMDEDASTLADEYATLDTYYGALSAFSSGSVVGHERRQYNSASDSAIGAYGLTYSDTFTPTSSGTYANSAMKYAVSADGTVRIGSGIGPELGINVALAAPRVTGSGVYIYPQYVVNAASWAPFTAGVTPGEMVTLAGQNLAGSTQQATALPLPTTGLVSPTQVSFLVPYEVSTSLASIQLINGGANGGTSNTVTLPVNLTTPGLFTFQQNGLGPPDAEHADYSLVNSASPAQPGETILLFVTGLGAVNPLVPDGAAGPSTTLSVANNTISAYFENDTDYEQATVVYAGLAPGEGGLYQVNVTVPGDLTSGNYYVDIAGPDSYTSEATIAVGTPATSSSSAEISKPLAHRPRLGRPR